MPISHSAVANIISPPPYITTIPLTEAPISEGGIYTLGGTHALDWQDPQTTGGTPGVAYVNGTSPGQATDNLCILKGKFSPLRHFTRFTVKRQSGYVPANSHEIEGLVGFDLTAHNARGYEWDFGLGQNVIVVRWNGGLDDYTVLGDPNGNLANGKGWTDTPSGSGVIGGLNDGDDVYISYVVAFDSGVGGLVPTMTMYANGAQVYTVKDTSAFRWTWGSPGWGFFARPDATLVKANYGVKRMSAGNEP
jgi:hypothetical protein